MLTDQVCVIVSINCRSPVTVLFILLANEVNLLLSNRNKEHQKPKSSHNGILLEGEVKSNIDDWYSFVEPSIIFTLEWKYVYINI